MAIGANTVFEIRSTATAGNVNGGGFNPSNATPGVDYSQQDAAQWHYTDLVSTNATNAAPQISSVARPFVANDCGNLLRIVSGTSWTNSPGVYEIVSVSAGVATLDKACGASASISGGNGYLGGAWSLGSASDNSQVAAILPASYFGTVWIKAGTYSIIASINMSSVSGDKGSGFWKFQGYNTVRGDNPTGTNRPKIVHTVNNLFIILGSFCEAANLNVICASNSGYGPLSLYGGYGRMINVRLVNYSTTANMPGTLAGTFCQYIRCEFVCTAGYAIANTGAMSFSFHECYFHDSNYGAYNNYAGASEPMTFSNCIFEHIITACFSEPAGQEQGWFIVKNCTFYGGETVKVGTGIEMNGTTTLASQLAAFNNIFYGLVTGIKNGQLSNVNWENYNNFYNNTTDRTNFVTGPNSIALNPAFAGVGQYVNVGTVTSSGSVLTDTGAAFTNVVAGRDFVYVTAMTGGNGVGIYPINAKTASTLTCDNALGSGTAITYSIIWGHNFAVGTNMKATSAPHANIYSTSYVDLGAIQRSEPAAGDLRSGVDYGTLVVPTLANTKTGVAGDGGTGTYDGSDRWSDLGIANARAGTPYKANSLT
ncbi:MAG: hypothetical protein ACXWQE_00005, partial [Bdellovibrionales bacterium]